MSQQTYFKPFDALTFATVTAYRSRFVKLLVTDQPSSIHCDLADVQTCDSAGLAFLIDAQRLCRTHNTQLVIVHISSDIRALAKLYGVEKILDYEEL